MLLTPLKIPFTLSTSSPNQITNHYSLDHSKVQTLTILNPEESNNGATTFKLSLKGDLVPETM